MIPYVKDDKQDEASDYVAQGKEVPWRHKLLLNRPIKVIGVSILLAVLAPVLIYHYFFFSSLDLPPSDGFSTGSCLLPRSTRLPCGIIGNISDTKCHPQCCYDYELQVCFHRFPSRFTYIIEDEWIENMTLTPRISTVPYKYQESVNIQIAIDEITSTHLAISFYNPNHTKIEGHRIAEKNYTWHISNPELSIVVKDNKDLEIFDTAKGPIIASENIWEISFKTTNDTMYGFGEIPLVQGTVKILYNHDGSSNSIPLIFSRANDTYHGVLIDVVEPTELRVEGENQILIRSITNKGLKFHLFTGPEPKDIMREVMKIIDFQNKLDYWMLGAHICSETLTTESTNAYDNLVDFATAAANEKLPYDSHCGTAPVEFHDQCGENERREKFVKGMELVKSYKKRFVPHVSPYIFYKEVNNTDEDNSTEVIEPRLHHNCSNIIPQFESFMLRTANSKELYKGQVNNKTVLYPDYEVISEEFITKLWAGPEIDGVILENNWPIDESLKQHNETYDYLPYYNENFEIAFNHTPQWNATKPNNETYIYSHNQFGNYFAKAIRLTKQEDSPIYTSSQWLTGDIVNRQNIDASWTNLHRELIEAALGGISGHWLWSSPICGDTEHYNDTTQTQLCVKWYMAATFLPLIKIHSKETSRHPLAFSGTNRANILKGLKNRYSLLPYFYTILQQGPLLRPMFYQFPFARNVTNLRSQFSVGDDLLIVPNLQPSQSHVHVTMPPGHWYEFWSGFPIEAEDGEIVTMTTTDADFLILIRAGAVVVMQKDVGETAEDTRRNSDYSITISLNCRDVNETETEGNNSDERNCQANGELHANDGMKIIFEANSKQLIIKSKGENFKPLCDTQNATWASVIREIIVFGLEAKHNNSDHLRNVVVWSNLCQLESQEAIVINFY